METLNEFKDKLISEQGQQAKSKSIFDIKPANDFIERAKKRAIPRMLFGEFWFEGEVCILFADTNVGKSILAVQIGNSISTGISTCGLNLGCPPTPIIYFDFELSDKQFENRYSTDYQDHFQFHENFLRAEINHKNFDDKSLSNFDEILFHSLEKAVLDSNAKILIVDNITYLNGDNERAKDALPLMKFLQDLQDKYGLSILVLAHTPKIDPYKPITNNHLSGSKMLMNFCDSSFAIGVSYQEKSWRYIKQIKQRNCEELYGFDNVIVCEIEKVASFLRFSFIGFESENEQLKCSTGDEKNDRNANILDLFSKGKTKSEIGRQLKVSEGTVRNILKKNNL
jgi:hypothetical protein